MSDKLTHIDARGEARMVDVSDKPATERIAVAQGCVVMSAATLAIIRSGNAKKGDVLGTARIAGIMAAKKTSDLIPLCHPIGLSGVEVEVLPKVVGIEVRATVKTVERTGVEMEALSAVAAATLTVYDMLKSTDRAMVIEAIQLEFKSGGRSGIFTRAAQGDASLKKRRRSTR